MTLSEVASTLCRPVGGRQALPARTRRGGDSNLPFKQWAEFLPSPAQAVAIADRLVDDATILRFSGQSYRHARDVYGAPLENE